MGRRYAWNTKDVVCERDNWTCWLCGAPVQKDLPVEHEMRATMDHVIPVSQGGSNNTFNLRLAHYQCNTVRKTKPIEALPLASMESERNLALTIEKCVGLNSPFVKKIAKKLWRYETPEMRVMFRYRNSRPEGHKVELIYTAESWPYRLDRDLPPG